MKRNRTIKEKIDSLSAEIFNIGDVIDFSLTDGERVEALAVKEEKSGMLFVLLDCLKKEYPMNEESTNEGGYENSDLRVILNEEILDRFPAEIREKMVAFDNGNLLRLPTEKEIFGENPYGEEEGNDVRQWEPMKLRRNRIAFRGKNGDWEWYWLQNKTKDSATAFALVYNLGVAGTGGTSTSLGVRPVFLLS
jgi:hypothetical protein